MLQDNEENAKIVEHKKWKVWSESWKHNQCIYILIGIKKNQPFSCLKIIVNDIFGSWPKIHGMVNDFMFLYHVEVMLSQAVGWIAGRHCVILTTSASITSDQKFSSKSISNNNTTFKTSCRITTNQLISVQLYK